MKSSEKSTALVRGVLIGAGCAGVVSLIPLVNLLNLFFMFWMAIGGFIGVWILQRRNRRATPGEAVLCGGLSGFLGGLIFAAATYLIMLFITPEAFNRILTLLNRLLPSLRDEMDPLTSAGDFRDMLGVVLSFAVGVSGLVGILGGLIARWAWTPVAKEASSFSEEIKND